MRDLIHVALSRMGVNLPMSTQEVPMEKIFIAAVIILSLAAAGSAQVLHVSHLHILKERNANKSCRFKVLHVGCDADEVGKVTPDRLEICS